MLFSNTPKKVVGVDIGNSSVKLVGLSRIRGGYHLEAIGSARIPKDAVVDGEIFNLGAVSTVLREVVSASKISGASAFTGCSAQASSLKGSMSPSCQRGT